MAYLITELPQAKEYFQNVFNPERKHIRMTLPNFYESFMSAFLKRIVIDIVKFDKELRVIHPDDELLSLAELVLKYYGDEGLSLLEEII